MFKRLIAPLTLVACLVVMVAANPSWAKIVIQHNKSTKLDGLVLVSPSAMRVTTALPDSGGPIGPGVTARRAMLVQNRSRKTITIDLALAEVVGSTNPDEQVIVRDGDNRGAAAWVKLDGSSATLLPGDTATIQIAINIPKQVKPGSKSFAVTVTQRNSTTVSSGGQVNPLYRQVAIFVVDLPGNAPVKGHIISTTLRARGSNDQTGDDKRGIGHLYLGSHKFNATVSYVNEGERLLTPQGHIEVTDLFGRVVAHYNVPSFTAYPEGAAAAAIELKKLPSFGVLHSKLVLESAAGRQSRSLGTLIVAPWWVLVATGVLLLALVVTIARFVINRRRWRKLADEEAGAGDDDGDDEDINQYADDIDDDDQ